MLRFCKNHTPFETLAGFPKSFEIFAYGSGGKRYAIIINNYNIDAVAIK
jgi:hypothetical protein